MPSRQEYDNKNMPISQLLSLLKGVKKVGKGYLAHCPAHDDSKQSLSVSEADDGKILMHCHAGCEINEICNALGIAISDLFPKRKLAVYEGGKSRVIAVYEYHDAAGELCYQVCRTADKRFFLRRPDGTGGWLYDLKNVKRVLYRLPQVLETVKKSETVFIVEGEKDCDSLAQIGLTATTNPFGAGKWESSYSDYFKGGTVVILADNDEPGRRHAEQVAKSLCGKAASVKVVNLPNLPEKGDVSDWLAAGGTKEELLRLAQEAPEWDPSKQSPDKETEGKKEAKKDSEKESQADALIRIATSDAFLFHNEVREGFANFLVDDHRETWQLRSKFFYYWLVNRFFKETEKSPNNQALRQALNVIEAKAVFDGPEIKLNLRVAKDKDGIWYDLANATWQAVKITAAGWEVVNEPPILFRRYKNTAAQVTPKRGGKLDLLRKYINLKNETDWVLLFAHIIHMFIPDVPHTVAIFYGGKGGAKTTAQRVIRKLIDPAHRDTMAMPLNKNEMALVLMTNYAPAFDNLDGLIPWQSDMLCQAATGGGISKRELYSDVDEVIISFLRCPMLNGINQVASRDDLLDRSILFKLERIEKKQRKTENDFWQEFEQDRPYILGAIFDALSGALRVYPTVKLPELPRMADFATWGYAIMEAISGSGDKFMEAYCSNIAGAVEEAVIGDVVGAAVAEFMDDKEIWEGTATELLQLLAELPSVNIKDKEWPKQPNILTRRLNNLKSALSDYGINIYTDNRSKIKRKIIINKEIK